MFLFCVISSRFCFQQGNTVSTLVESSGGGRAGRLPLKTQQRQGSSKAPRNCRLPTTRTQTAMVHLEQPQPRDRRPGQASPLKAREANPDRDTKRREAVPGVTNQSKGGATRQRRTLGGESSTISRAVRVQPTRTASDGRPGQASPLQARDAEQADNDETGTTERREARAGVTTPSTGSQQQGKTLAQETRESQPSDGSQARLTGSSKRTMRK